MKLLYELLHRAWCIYRGVCPTCLQSVHAPGHIKRRAKARTELPVRISCVCGHCHNNDKCGYVDDYTGQACYCTKHIVLDWEKQQ